MENLTDNGLMEPGEIKLIQEEERISDRFRREFIPTTQEQYLKTS